MTPRKNYNVRKTSKIAKSTKIKRLSNLVRSIEYFKQKDSKLFRAHVLLKNLESLSLAENSPSKRILPKSIKQHAIPSALNISSEGKDVLSVILEARKSLRKTSKYKLNITIVI